MWSKKILSRKWTPCITCVKGLFCSHSVLIFSFTGGRWVCKSLIIYLCLPNSFIDCWMWRSYDHWLQGTTVQYVTGPPSYSPATFTFILHGTEPPFCLPSSSELYCPAINRSYSWRPSDRVTAKRLHSVHFLQNHVLCLILWITNWTTCNIWFYTKYFHRILQIRWNVLISKNSLFFQISFTSTWAHMGQ
jgi:hypothetical protein